MLTYLDVRRDGPSYLLRRTALEPLKAVVLALFFACICCLVSWLLPGSSTPRILLVGAATGIPGFIALILWERWHPSSRIDYSSQTTMGAVASRPIPNLDDLLAQSAMPSLRVGPALEMDNERFRLRVFNDSDVRCRPRVVVTATADDKGNQLLPSAQAPLELAWTHHREGQRASLARSDAEGETVAVFWVRTPRAAVKGPALYVLAKELLLYGMHHRPLLVRLMDFKRGRTIQSHLVISCPEFPSTERIECGIVLTRDRKAPLGFRAALSRSGR